MCGLTPAGLRVSNFSYICIMASIYSRSGGDGSATPPQGASGSSHNGSVSQTVSSSHTGAYKITSGWQQYANKQGKVTSPPNYPDVSYQAFLRQGGNALGIGYNAWRDRLLADYNTAYNMYQQWYNETAQQVGRIAEAGLNTNLAYGMATPGDSPGSALAQSSGPSPEQVFFGGINALVGLASGTKALAEAATILNELPESKLKGNIARQIDSAAKAGAINAENTYLGSLFGARNALGVGSSKAQQEKAQNSYEAAKADASERLLEYMTSHDEEGNTSDFESSLYNKSEIATKSDAIISYKHHKAEWDHLFSNPSYYTGLLNKAVAEGVISSGQAFVTQQILQDPGMDNFSKMLALQPGLVGFLAKAMFGVTSNIPQTTGSNQPFTDTFKGPFYRDENGKFKIKWAGRGGLFFNY